MESKILNSSQLMDLILHCLGRGKPLSVVSLGASETFVLAQYTLLSEEEFMNHAEAAVANKGKKRGYRHRGVRFPNIKARDKALETLFLTDVLGYNMMVRDEHSGLLTEKVMKYYGLRPPYTFEAYLRRVIMFSQWEKFQEMLREKRIIIVCGYADEVKASMDYRLQKTLGFEIVGALKIFEFEEVPRLMEELNNYPFDLCLLAAGVNAIILGAYISHHLGKVAFDLGIGMESLITGKPNVEDLLVMLGRPGVKKLMKM